MSSLLTEALTGKTLADIPIKQVHEAQQAAAVRLHLFVMGETHEALNKVLDAGTAVLSNYNADGPIPGTVSTLALQAMLRAWDDFMRWYTDMLERAIITAASMPFGVWAIYHNEWIRPYTDQPVNERRYRSRGGKLLLEQLNPDAIFQPQLESVVLAAKQRTYGDTVRLSQRIWKLDSYGREGLNTAVNLAVMEGKSAWALAQDVEQFLGAGRDCPRWTRQRLYGLTKADIAGGNQTGLISGDECAGQGVSYNALRLARTEIQWALNEATTRTFKQMPWIELEKVNLSPAHAETDICDDVASGGDNGDGSYKVGDVSLPLHPHCLCFKTAVLANNAAFVNRLKGWLGGQDTWPEMDIYHATLNHELWTDLRDTAVGVSLAYWLWEGAEALGGLFWNMALGR